MPEIPFPDNAMTESETIDPWYPGLIEVDGESGSRDTIVRGWPRWKGNISFGASYVQGPLEICLQQLQSSKNWTHIPMYWPTIKEPFTAIAAGPNFVAISSLDLGLEAGVFLNFNGLLQRVTHATKANTRYTFGIFPDFEPTGTSPSTYTATVPTSIAVRKASGVNIATGVHNPAYTSGIDFQWEEYRA